MRVVPGFLSRVVSSSKAKVGWQLERCIFERKGLPQTALSLFATYTFYLAGSFAVAVSLVSALNI